MILVFYMTQYNNQSLRIKPTFDTKYYVKSFAIDF